MTTTVLNSDSEYAKMMLAIEQMHKSVSEPGRVSPAVGALLARGSDILAVAHRGELGIGDHAEFTLLEKKLDGADLAGTTLYTTLEPCTERNEPKLPCAQRIVDRGVSKVWVGMMDPNPDITGQGCYKLRQQGVEIGFFPGELMSRVETANEEFTREHRPNPSDVKRAELLASRELDGWFTAINRIYGERNSHQSLSYVFAHLVEVIGGLSCLASEKTKPSIDPVSYVQKALAWWFALCGHAGVRSAADVVWRKFPSVCPYCEQATHDDDICRAAKARGQGANWPNLFEFAEVNTQPKRLNEWLKMFRKIYPVQQSETFGPTFARLSEELGELAEAVRLFDHEPHYFLSEAADVFAWIMRIENIRETKANTAINAIGSTLDSGMGTSYPDFCLDCEARPCRCPRVLKRTVGRIAIEMPEANEREAIFMNPEERRAMFRI